MADLPIILAVADEPMAVGAVVRDLQSHYGARFQIVRAGCGTEALETMCQLKLRNRVIELFLVDQRMPEMTGTEFLEQAIRVFPDANRVQLRLPMPSPALPSVPSTTCGWTTRPAGRAPLSSH